MCLLVIMHRAHAEAPLVVAANRDELLSRPARAMTVLQEGGPRIVGGRDELAGGSWLAINEHGVVAGLTNVPSRRDAAKRSRGELPLALAGHEHAAAAVEHFSRTYSPTHYNPAWLLIGDREDLFYVDFGSTETARAQRLPPGIHVLENRPLGERSPKIELVRRAIEGAESVPTGDLPHHLAQVLRSHELPANVRAADITAADRPRETLAPCVHAGPYGTRSSTIVIVPEAERPSVWFTEGPPCQAPLAPFEPGWPGAGQGRRMSTP